MITKDNFIQVLRKLGFEKCQKPHIYSKSYGDFNCTLQADLLNNKPIYPDLIKSEGDFTKNFKQPESYVVFVCIAKLLNMGYRPEHIVIEKTWTLGHSQKSGRADISVYDETGQNVLLIIECKQAGQKYQKAKKDLYENKEGKQLFSYKAQARAAKWLQLYAADYDEENDEIIDFEEIVKSHDDKNVETLAKNDSSILLYQNASEAPDIYRVWDETYNKKTYKGLIFGKETKAYKIGVRPLRKCDLRRFNKEDGIANGFAERLRHNSISDKENAFNKLLSLFICKLVDEKEHGDNEVLDFQYKEGTDDYFTLYERLLRLFHFGMNKFLKEDVFYLEDSYISDTLSQYTGKKRKYLEEELKRSFQRTKLLSCQVFAFREIYNEKLFMQNGKVLVEMVELFQNYRLSYSSRQQFLGELFEQFLGQGFKQDEGQFFTPIPITRFIWNSLPLERFINCDTDTFPKVIDYACGAGHFLTEGIAAISDYIKTSEQKTTKEGLINEEKISKTFYGIEKDNRLARVSKIALLLNGANEAHIKAMDGLYHDANFLGERNSFDILVANPPYSVNDFKLHIDRRLWAEFGLLQYMSSSCKNIENVFVERINQLLKPNGIAAVILPNSVLNGVDTDYIKTRELILKNFKIHCITHFEGKTFGKTPTRTEILFLEKFSIIPNRTETLKDCVDAIFSNDDLEGWEEKEIFEKYLRMIDVNEEDYRIFSKQIPSLERLEVIPYFKQYTVDFLSSNPIINLQGSDQYKKLPEREKEALLCSKFYEYYIDLEKEKIYYFAIVYQQNVLLINAPADVEEQKAFLGYDNIARKKHEGLKEREGVLTDSSNRNSEDKLAWLVKSMFNGEQIHNEQLSEYISFSNLAYLMDFKHCKFYKSISPQKNKGMSLISAYPTEPLGLIAPFVTKRVIYDDIKPSTYISTENMLKNRDGIVDYKGTPNVDSIVGYKANDILISNIRPYLKKIWFADHDGGCSADVLVFRVIEGKVLPKYLYYILGLDLFFEFMMSENKGMKMPRGNKLVIPTFEIPVPPPNIQEQVVKECEIIDKEYYSSRMSPEEYSGKITQVLRNMKVIVDS